MPFYFLWHKFPLWLRPVWWFGDTSLCPRLIPPAFCPVAGTFGFSWLVGWHNPEQRHSQIKLKSLMWHCCRAQNLRFRITSLHSANGRGHIDRKSTRLNSSHLVISYAVFCL